MDYAGIAELIASVGTAVASVGALWVRQRREDEDEPDDEVHREIRQLQAEEQLEVLRERAKKRHKPPDGDSGGDHRLHVVFRGWPWRTNSQMAG